MFLQEMHAIDSGKSEIYMVCRGILLYKCLYEIKKSLSIHWLTKYFLHFDKLHHSLTICKSVVRGILKKIRHNIYNNFVKVCDFIFLKKNLGAFLVKHQILTWFLLAM